MAEDNTKTDEAEKAPRSRRRRLKLFLQLANLVVLPILLILFLLYIVDRQINPMYGWVADTPVERVSLVLIRTLWRQKGFLERQALNSALTPEERAQVTAILRKMEVTRPTHALQIKTGERLFGRLTEADDGDGYIIRYFDGERYRKREIAAADIIFKQRLVIPEVPLEPRDLRFLISYPELNHFYLPPYLFAVQGDFARAFEVQVILSGMQEEFREAFGALIEDEDAKSIHVCLFSGHAELLRQSAGLADVGMVNSAGFFSKSDNRLMLPSPEAGIRGEHHYFQDRPLQVRDRVELLGEWQRLVRHEGAHQLASSFGVIREHDRTPFWVEEGLAQYCELSPADIPHPRKLDLLRRSLASKSLIPWSELLDMSTTERGKLDEAQLQIAYAQSWLLFSHLMDKTYRGHFFKFLLNRQAWEAVEDGGYEQIELMNTLKTTREVLEMELRERIRQSEEV